MPDRKLICPDHPRRRVSMFRLSQTENAYVQTFVRSKIFVRSLCLQKSPYPDFCAFKIAYVQTFVRSKRKFERSKIDNLYVHVQTILCSKDPISRLSCVQNCLRPNFVCSKPKFVRCKIDILCVLSRISCFQKTLCHFRLDISTFGLEPQPGLHAK